MSDYLYYNADAMEYSSDEGDQSQMSSSPRPFQKQVIGDSGSWAEVERLCLKLADLAATAQRSEKTPEDVKLEAARLFEAIDGNLPRPASFETEQVPALLMELRNVRAAPVTFLPPPRYGSRRELVEKFADEKKVTVPIAPPMFAASGSAVVPETVKAPPPIAVLMCSFCGTQTSPEWRKGPNGPKTLCNACGLVYSKMVKTRKVAKK